MSLLQQFFAWDFSKTFRPWTGHVHVRSLLIMILSNWASVFATEQKHIAWEFRPGFLSKILAFFLNIHPERALYYCFVKGSLVIPVSACSGTALVTAQLSTLWNGKKKMISELIHLSFLWLSLVMEVLDLSLLDISIWILAEHGSETCHGKRPEPHVMLCLLEYDCGANALG